ncbi:hypothetical protein GPALN_012863 [Globodera pallida]|nr:hypothetical protein GPALN_012863 [Globodera pallida]
MVNKRRYNSVERFASIHLSEFEERQQLRPAEPLSISANNANRAVDFPTSMPSPSHQQQLAHPFTLMRRRSHEQLPPATDAMASDSSPQAALLLQRQINKVPPPGSGSHSLASPLPPYPQQQKPLRPLQQPMPPRSILAHSLPDSNFQADSPHSVAFVPFVPPSSPYFQPLQIRPQKSPRDIQSIQQASARADGFSRTDSFPAIPAPIWATLSVLEVIVGIISLFIGALNASPYNCMVEPNIPIYLILSGLFLILNGGARIFLGLSAASTKRPRQIRSEHRKSTTRPVLNYAVEGIGLFAILVLVILGSVWVYGASRYMHSQLYMFERHFCEHTLYWTAWWSVTIHLGVFALLILLGIVVLIYAAVPGGE